jgi:hypothetical protein
LTTSLSQGSRQRRGYAAQRSARNLRHRKSRIFRNAGLGTGAITFRRRTTVRAGVFAALLAALGIGFVIGLAMSSPLPPASRVVVAASTTPTAPLSTITTAIPKTAQSAPSPTVLPCGARSTQQMRPTVIDIGCASVDIGITTITWSSWGSDGGSGSGVLHENNCQPSCATGSVTSSPAFVVVSNPVGGVFQDVLITPPSDVMTPQSSSQPGSGWGSGSG